MKILGLFAGIITALIYPALCISADNYPEKTVTVIVPFPAGDGSDIAARLATDELSKILKTEFVVVNKPGAGGAIGVESVVKAPKDGYTILFTTNTPLTIRKVADPATANYEPSRDLIPLGLIARFASIIAVRNDAPYKTIDQLVLFSRENPRGLRFGTPGVGSLGELNISIINAQIGTGIIAIPYKGSTPAVTDLLGGHIDGVAVSLGSLSAHIKSGEFKGIVISKKFPDFKDIPTLSDNGYKDDIIGIWVGFFAPTGTPKEAVGALVPAVRITANNRELSEKLFAKGILGEYSPPESVNGELKQEFKKIGDIVKRAATPK